MPEFIGYISHTLTFDGIVIPRLVFYAVKALVGTGTIQTALAGDVRPQLDKIEVLQRNLFAKFLPTAIPTGL